MMKRFLVFIFFMQLGVLQAQDVQYSQFYANPLYLNPALTGSTGFTRLGINFRNQWPALDQSFIAYSAYADHFVEKYNSGIGLIISGAKESFTQSQVHEIGLLYSYRLRLGERNFINAGFQGSFVARDALFDQVILGTQLDIDRGTIIRSPGDGFEGDSKLRDLDLHAGLIYYDDRFWFGASAFYLLGPEISYL